MQTGCRANANPAVVAEKISRVHSGPNTAINAFVDSLKAGRPGCDLLYVDPDYGGVEARILMLLQDPGPQASAGGSNMLSISNNDSTAQTVCELLDEAAIPWKDVLAWNAVPWYTGGKNSAADVSRRAAHAGTVHRAADEPAGGDHLRRPGDGFVGEGRAGLPETAPVRASDRPAPEHPRADSRRPAVDGRRARGTTERPAAG